MAATVENFLRGFNANLERPVRQHLINVYACLAASGLVASAGALIDFMSDLTYGSGFLSAIGALACSILLITTRDDGKNTYWRIGYLLAFSFLTGLNLGPLIFYAMAINPQIIVTALLVTTGIFASFSIVAMMATRGKWLYLGGTLMTLLMGCMIMSIANAFFESHLLYQTHLYLGLLVMCGFVLYDTQMIIEKRRMGDKDFVVHSVNLFIDMFGIFRRLVVILAQKEERKKKKN